MILNQIWKFKQFLTNTIDVCKVIVDFGQILCSGDSLTCEEWDKREYKKREDIREYVLRITLDVCLKL